MLQEELLDVEWDLNAAPQHLNRGSGAWAGSIGGLEMGSHWLPRIPTVSRNLACSCKCLLLVHQSYQHAAPAAWALRMQPSHLICQSHLSHCKAKLNFLCCDILLSVMHIPLNKRSPETLHLFYGNSQIPALFVTASWAVLAAERSVTVSCDKLIWLKNMKNIW